ncbi:hypothetical protein HDU67_008820, partial [Dinochytrium kinnereticum]
GRLSSQLSVVVATGAVLFSTLGTEKRKEAGLSGIKLLETARLLYVERESGCIAIDIRTMETIKGKHEETEVWGIRAKTLSKTDHRKTTSRREMIGNFREIDILKSGVGSWMQGKTDKFIAKVEGVSGMGKSSLLSHVHGFIEDFNQECCIARGSDVEQTSPYAAIQFLFPKLLSLVITQVPTRKASKKDAPKRNLSISVDRSRLTYRRESRTCTDRRDGNDNLIEPIAALLTECGENAAYAGIISEVVFGRMSAKDDAANMRGKVEPEAKSSIVKALVVKMMVKAISKHSIIILLDDAQILRSGNKQVNRDLIAALEADGTLAILEKTSGNLLKVDIVVKYLVEHTSMLKKTETQLELDHWQSLDSLLSTKVETVIIAQFDRLDPLLQVILKLASILGQYFLLEDIFFLLDDETLDFEAIEEVIRKGDQFDFVQIDECFETESLDFSFRHICIRNAIYESIALAERQRLHLMVAERYEELLKEDLDQTMSIMPLMCYHFWRSGDVKKMVITNLDLGCILVDDNHYLDGRNVLFQVFDFLEVYESEEIDSADTKTVRPQISSFLTPERLASALSKVAWSSTNITDFFKSQACAIKALRLSGIDWPETEREAKPAVFRALMTLIFRWISTRGGMVDLHYGNSVEWHSTVKTSLNAMTLISSLHGAFRKYQNILIVIWTFNHAILRCESNASSWFQTMTMYSYLLGRYPWASKLCKFLVKRSCRIRDRCDDSVKDCFHIYGALLLSLLDSPRDSLEASRISLRFWTDRKLPVEQLKSYIMRFYANIMVGEFYQQHRDITVGLAKDMSRRDPLWTLANLVSLQLEAFFTGRLDTLQEWNQIVIPLANSFKEITRIQFGYVEGVGELLETILNSSEFGSIEPFERILAVLHQVATQPLLENVFMVLLVPLVLYMSVCALPSKVSEHPLQYHQLHRLSKAISAAEKALKKFSGILLLTKVGHRLMQACSVYCDAELCRINVDRRRRTVIAWFKALLDRPKFVGRFGEGGDYVTLGGVCCAVIGTVSAKEDERKIYSNRAARLFNAPVNALPLLLSDMPQFIYDKDCAQCLDSTSEISPFETLRDHPLRFPYPTTSDLSVLKEAQRKKEASSPVGIPLSAVSTYGEGNGKAKRPVKMPRIKPRKAGGAVIRDGPSMTSTARLGDLQGGVGGEAVISDESRVDEERSSQSAIPIAAENDTLGSANFADAEDQLRRKSRRLAARAYYTEKNDYMFSYLRGALSNVPFANQEHLDRRFISITGDPSSSTACTQTSQHSTSFIPTTDTCNCPEVNQWRYRFLNRRDQIDLTKRMKDEDDMYEQRLQALFKTTEEAVIDDHLTIDKISEIRLNESWGTDREGCILEAIMAGDAVDRNDKRRLRLGDGFTLIV